MNVAVTGANGHVGVNLCSTLKEKGHFVRALSHDNDFGLKHIEVESFKGDLLNRDSLQHFLDGIDVVIHLAARISIKGDPDGSVRRVNVEGTRNILHVARENKIKKFVHFSSIHAFRQEPLDQVLNELRPIVDSDGFAYDRSKAEGERMVMAAAKDGFDAVVVCPTAIIGPHDYEPSLIGKAMLQLYRHQIPALVPGGYNWVDVRDVVNGCISAISNGRKGEKYLLSGKWRSLKEISAIITKCTGVKITQSEMPFAVAKIGLPFITAYSKLTRSEPLYTKESLVIIKHGNRNISNDKARKELGFNPRPIEETISDLFAWFRQNGYLQ
jgi:dihydroflavonol-4-reductase